MRQNETMKTFTAENGVVCVCLAEIFMININVEMGTNASGMREQKATPVQLMINAE